MAVVTSDLIAALVTNFRAVYEQTFMAAMMDTHYQDFAMEVPSTTLIESYSWFGSVPEPREWTDERQDGGLYPFNFQAKNLDYEDTISVDRNEIEDDRLGIVRPRIEQLGQAYPIFIEKNLVQALVNGAVSGNNSYDGVSFYNASHVIGKAAAQSNISTFTGYDTQAHLQTDFSVAKAKMMNFQDDQGRPMGLVGNFILANPDAEQNMRILLNSSFLPVGSVGSASNTFAGQADLAISPYVAASTWHLLCTKMPMRPLIFQNRKPPEFVSLDRPDDQTAFMRKKFYYGIDFRCAFVYGEWFMAVKVV